MKGDYLYHFNLPQLDLLVWILIMELVPTYYQKLEVMLNDIGCFCELPKWRIKAMRTQITMPMNERYHPDIRNFICTCPQFIMSQFLLCKQTPCPTVKPGRSSLFPQSNTKLHLTNLVPPPPQATCNGDRCNRASLPKGSGWKWGQSSLWSAVSWSHRRNRLLFLLFTLPLFPFCLTTLFSIRTIHCDSSALTHTVP